jgi:hypothetical protein
VPNGEGGSGSNAPERAPLVKMRTGATQK